MFIRLIHRYIFVTCVARVKLVPQRSNAQAAAKMRNSVQKGEVRRDVWRVLVNGPSGIHTKCSRTTAQRALIANSRTKENKGLAEY